MNSRLRISMLMFLAALVMGATSAGATNYVITDQASWQSFLTAVGATGSYSVGTCYITDGTLPAGDTLTVSGSTMLRPQSGTFTNQGMIVVDSADFFGFYVAGTFDNLGAIYILQGNPQNYATINNHGTFDTAVALYNGGSFHNFCDGTVTGTIMGDAVIDDCTTPVEETSWGAVKARYGE